MVQSHAESMKKILGALQDLPANQHSQFSHNSVKWAELAVLVSWQFLKGSQDFFHTFSMALYHKLDVKNVFAYVLQFFSLISDGLGGVSSYSRAPRSSLLHKPNNFMKRWLQRSETMLPWRSLAAVSVLSCWKVSISYQLLMLAALRAN